MNKLKCFSETVTLFRITRKGCSPVEAPTATKAWSALFSSHDSAHTLGFSGAKQFGLQRLHVHTRLSGLLRSQACPAELML